MPGLLHSLVSSSRLQWVLHFPRGWDSVCSSGQALPSDFWASSVHWPVLDAMCQQHTSCHGARLALAVRWAVEQGTARPRWATGQFLKPRESLNPKTRETQASRAGDVFPLARFQKGRARHPEKASPPSGSQARRPPQSGWCLLLHFSRMLCLSQSSHGFQQKRRLASCHEAERRSTGERMSKLWLSTQQNTARL